MQIHVPSRTRKMCADAAEKRVTFKSYWLETPLIALMDQPGLHSLEGRVQLLVTFST